MTKQQILDAFVASGWKDKDMATARLMLLGWDRKGAEDIVWSWAMTKTTGRDYQ